MDMDIEFMAMIMLVGLAILIPIIGLTARFSLKPIVDAIVRLREPSPHSLVGGVMAEQRLARLEAEMQALRAVLEPIAERATLDLQRNGATAAPGHRIAASVSANGATGARNTGE